MKNKHFLYLLLVSALLLLITSTSAANLHATLTLQRLTVVQANEKLGDEIYLLITQKMPNNKNQYYTVPGTRKLFENLGRSVEPQPYYPSVFWKQENLDKVNDISIWDGDIDPQTSTTLFVTVMESDAPPWDIDDSIGSIKIVLSAENGKLSPQFLADKNAKILTTLHNTNYDTYIVIMGENNGVYRVNFNLATSAQ